MLDYLVVRAIESDQPDKLFEALSDSKDAADGLKKIVDGSEVFKNNHSRTYLLEVDGR